MAFQEPIDPFVEKLQELIEVLKQDINYKEFENVLKIIDEEFPFVDLIEFLEMYVDGEYSRVLIEKFHLLGYTDYYKLLQILKLNKKRISGKKNSESRKINFGDKSLAKRYEFLHRVLSKYQKQIKNKINHNVLRAIIILELFSNSQNFINKKEISQSIFQAIQNLEHLVLAPHAPLSTINNGEINELADMIISDLRDNLFIETDEQDNFRLLPHQLLISEYIFKIIQNRTNGVTYQELITSLKEKLPIIAQIPSALIVITLQDLIDQNKIIRKEGYWKFKPFFDQFFTSENYQKMNSENSYTFRKNREFFGRRITPDEFIQELFELQRGNFEDQDDQVTRIAGMILTNSNMMSHPPNELKDFDFVVDLSSYEFTKEQQQVIQNLNLVITSNVIYIKVMINEKITVSDISDLILKLKARERNEQGFIISFENTDKLIEQILEKNKTIQIISKKELEEWCKITPIIPSRRGAVAVVRQGDNRGSIVKIKSINYESGRADIILFPKMEEKTQYIGALEEITIPVSIKNFVEYSNIYFQFLGKLRQISNTDLFRKIVSQGLTINSRHQDQPKIDFIPEKYMGCSIQGGFKTEIDFTKILDALSLRYAIKDLFSCTCFQWNRNSRKNGLCDHLIFTLNEAIKEILASEKHLSYRRIEFNLKQIEKRMDLFLNRLRYSNCDESINAECPKCRVVVGSLKEVEDIFGFRQMKKENKFSLRRQSQCKKCRQGSNSSK